MKLTTADSDLFALLYPVFDPKIKDSMNNLIDVRDLNNIPTKPGHYVILSTMKVRDCDHKIGDYYVWYNGTSASSLRGRLRGHLHESNKYKGSSAIAVETLHQQDIIDNTSEEWFLKNNNYFKKVDKNNPDIRYRNGINVADYPNEEFYVCIIVTDKFQGLIEQLFRDNYPPPPPLCKYNKR